MEIAVFMQEHRLDYYTFGFFASLLESRKYEPRPIFQAFDKFLRVVPIVGLLFSISNRVGAAMWAFDLEKRQEKFRKGLEKPKPPRTVTLPDGSTVEFAPSQWPEDDFVHNNPKIAGGWVEKADDDSTTTIGGEYVPGEGVVSKQL